MVCLCNYVTDFVQVSVVYLGFSDACRGCDCVYVKETGRVGPTAFCFWFSYITRSRRVSIRAIRLRLLTILQVAAEGLDIGRRFLQKR